MESNSDERRSGRQATDGATRYNDGLRKIASSITGATSTFNPQPRCINHIPNMLILPGSNALSAFRSQRLLSQLQSAAPHVAAVTARFVHFIDSSTPLSADDTGRLDAMLTYGEPAQGHTTSGATEEFFVIPRFGTISPWASKATDIAHNCGMAQIHRIERGIAYTLELKGGILGTGIGAARKLSESELAAVAGLLHDRMTESVLRSADQAALLFRELEARPLESIDLLTTRSTTWWRRSRARAAIRPTSN